MIYSQNITRKLIFIIFALILIGAGCGKAKATREPQPDSGQIQPTGKAELPKFSFKECVKSGREAAESTPGRPEEVDDAALETMVNDACYIEQAKALKDSASCEKISTKFRDEDSSLNAYAECINEVSSLNQNPVLCEKITGNKNQHDICLNTFNKTSKNTELCEKMLLPRNRRECISDVAQAVGNPKFCESMDSSLESYGYHLNYCIQYAAQAALDPSGCNLIKDARDRIPCIYFVARDAKNPKFCDLIDPQVDKDGSHKTECVTDASK